MHMAVEGSQTHLAAAEFQLAERGIDDLPIQFEGLCRRDAGKQAEQGGDGAAGGEHGDILFAGGLFEDAPQTAFDLFDIGLPALQAGLVMFAGNPAADQLGEQALELGAVLRAIAQDVQRFGLFR